MAKKSDPSKIKLKQPDRPGPYPDAKTLLDIVDERRLFEQAAKREAELRRRPNPPPDDSGSDADDEDDEDVGPLLSPRGERIAETVLWGVSLAMLHFTLDVLVQNQYGMAIEWDKIASRTVQAFVGECCSAPDPA